MLSQQPDPQVQHRETSLLAKRLRTPGAAATDFREGCLISRELSPHHKEKDLRKQQLLLEHSEVRVGFPERQQPQMDDRLQAPATGQTQLRFSE